MQYLCPFFFVFLHSPARTSPVSFPTAHRRHTDGTPTAEGSVDRRSTVGRLSAPLREWYGRDTEARRKRRGTTGVWQAGQYMTYIRHIYDIYTSYACHTHVICTLYSGIFFEKYTLLLHMSGFCCNFAHFLWPCGAERGDGCLRKTAWEVTRADISYKGKG